MLSQSYISDIEIIVVSSNTTFVSFITKAASGGSGGSRGTNGNDANGYSAAGGGSYEEHAYANSVYTLEILYFCRIPRHSLFFICGNPDIINKEERLHTIWRLIIFLFSSVALHPCEKVYYIL